MKYIFWSFLSLLIATFYHRFNHYDEACLAEQSYRFLQDGVVRSEFYRGLNHWEHQLVVFHKLHIYFGAGRQALFGFSLLAGKTIGLFWAVLGGGALWAYLRQQGAMPHFIWLGLTLYVANGLLVEFSFVNRPEPMYTTIGFLSFWLLVRQRWGWAALCAGLAALTHLNGLSFVLAGIFWLLWRRQFCIALAYGFSAGCVAGFYLMDVLVTQQWSLFAEQFQSDPALVHLQELTDKIKAMTHVGHMLSLTAEVAVLSLGITWLVGRQAVLHPSYPSRDVAQYGLGLCLAYFLITRSHSSHYILIFVPFASSYVALCVQKQPIEATRHWRRVGSSLLIGLYFIVSLYRTGHILWLNHTTPDVTQANARMARLIGQPGSRIIAPIDFFYEQIGHYQIHSTDYFMLLNGFPHHHLTTAKLIEAAQAEGAVAVVTYEGSEAPASRSPHRLGPYERIYQDRWNSLYRKRNKVP